MPNVLIRDLDDDVLEQLKAAAKANGRSLQAEIHDALRRANRRNLAETRRLSSKWLKRLGPFESLRQRDADSGGPGRPVTAFVVDASLVVKWFIPEVHSAAARRWLDTSHEYIAPDLVFPEVGNAIWKKVRRGEFTPEVAQSLVDDLATVGVEAVSMRVLVSDAHALAVQDGNHRV